MEIIRAFSSVVNQPSLQLGHTPESVETTATVTRRHLASTKIITLRQAKHCASTKPCLPQLTPGEDNPSYVSPISFSTDLIGRYSFNGWSIKALKPYFS